MSRIIDIDNQAVTIETDEGEIKQVTSTGLGFVPQIGDEVQVVDGGSRVFVLKTEPMYDGGDFSNNAAKPEVQGEAVSKLTYCLLAYILGGFGVHKFYAGKVGGGILYLLFCWTFIPLFLSRIDLIIALCRHDDGEGNITI